MAKTHQKTNLITGLTNDEVQERIKKGAYNKELKQISKSYRDILRDHVFTLFNAINIAMAVLVFLTGSYRNMMFMGVVLSNIAIGLFQEIRSKRMLERLSILTQPLVKVLREQNIQTISTTEVVIDDLILLETGNQVCSDCILQDGQLEMNEALITGESDLIYKQKGDFIYSGSFVVSGQGIAQVEHVGEENYVNTILKDVKAWKKYPSQLRNSIDFIIRSVSVIILPLGFLLFFKQYYIQHLTFHDAVLGSVAGIIGMIPEGLVLLTSVALAVGSIHLAKRKTLVQELYCIETLARVDVLCLDKTGTITEGNMKLESIECFLESQEEIENKLANMMEILQDKNATATAIQNAVKKYKTLPYISFSPFSSERKRSSVLFEDGVYMLGAYQYIMEHKDPLMEEKIKSFAKEGKRVLVLGKASQDKEYCDTICALLIFSDPIRKEAKQTLSYFEQQGVTIKIISGDDPITVHAIAKQAGVINYDAYIDMSTVNDDKIEEVVQNFTVFGRVSPIQKKLMIQALHHQDHTCAMIGDGVNDVMALREADCSISVAQGSDAAKNIANLVLLDNNFASIPVILNEGRRVINNIQRSASLFLVKTTFSMFLCVITLFLANRYPFAPIQLTLISTLTIGIPSFFLALEPNHNRVEGNFLINVFSKALPAALCVILSIFYVNVCASFVSIDAKAISTMCVILTAVCTFSILAKVCMPFSLKRSILFILMVILFFICFFCFKELFMLVHLSTVQTILTLVFALIIPFLMNIFIHLGSKLTKLKNYILKNSTKS